MTAQGEVAPPGLPAHRLSAEGPTRGAPFVCFFLAKILTCAAYDTSATPGRGGAMTKIRFNWLSHR